MNSKEAVERMKEIEKSGKVIGFYTNDTNDPIECGVTDKLEQEVKDLYEKFKDGCEKDWLWGTEYVQCGCGGTPEYLCPNCKEIKEVWERIK